MSQTVEERGPFKVTGRRVAYQNPWIRVVEDAVIRPDGSLGMFGVIEIGEGRGGVSVVPLDATGNIHLIREFMYAVNRYDVEVMGGGVDPIESELDAAKRELREELGIEASEWIDLGRIAHATTIMRGGSQMFLAKGFDPTHVRAEQGIEVVSLPLSDAVQMVMEGRISASATCCAILKTARLLGV